MDENAGSNPVRGKMTFKDILDSNKTIDDKFFELINLISDFVSILSNQFSKLEESLNGEIDIKNVYNIVTNINNSIKDIYKRIDNGEKPDFSKIEYYIKKISYQKNSEVLFTQKRIMENSSIDTKDKEEFTKALLIYKEILDKFDHVLYKLSLKWIEFRKLSKLKKLEDIEKQINNIV